MILLREPFGSVKTWAKKFLLFLLLVSLTSCSGLFYHPDHFLYYPPKQFGLIFEEIGFKAKDGQQLYGWFFPAQEKAVKVKAKGTLVQFHGNAENLSSHYASLVWLVSQGYNLFTFSYRGYGKSEGEPNQKGTYLDGLAALQKAWELNEKAKGQKFVVYGQSLGGAIAMRSVADFSQKDQVCLVVLDSTFLSYKKVAQRLLAHHWMTWLFSPLAQLLVSDEYSPDEALKENKIPLLVIHDRKDPVVSFANGEDLFEAAKSKKIFWPLEMGRHIGVFSSDHPELRKRFTDFLENLPRKASL